MRNTMNYKNYYGSVEFSDEDDVFFGRLIGIRDSVSYDAETMQEMKKAFQEAVDGYLEMCELEGLEPNITSKDEIHKVSIQKANEIMENCIAI